MPLKNPIIFETASSTYTANEIIGEGGSGRVYGAIDENGILFAIKVLDSSKASKEKYKRFKQEYRFLERNQHKNIVSVLDYGLSLDKSAKRSFYVMPFYQGSLRSLVAAGISPDKVLPYFGQLLDGVEAAHLLKVIHRDLKPENILYDQGTDRLVVADFGIAHFEQEDLYTTIETKPGERMANFLYAAPEQRTPGKNVDLRTDIYALGLILNEMFTGEVPQGAGYKLIAGVVPQFSYLDDLVATMIQQSPENRPASIENIKNQLIGRKNEFINTQKLNAVRNTVISASEINDPLITNPIRLIDRDWENNQLTLILSQPVNQKWIGSFQHLRSNHEAIMGKGPERFNISGNKASIVASNLGEIQPVSYTHLTLPTIYSV